MNSLLSLESAVIFLPENLTNPAMRAVEVLAEEIETRSRIRLPVETKKPEGAMIRMELAESPDLAKDGFSTRVSGDCVTLTGNDARGLIYAVGYFLRALHLDRGVIRLPLPFQTTTSPRWSIRGHQLGYRPLANSYNGWDVPQWDRYIRELALWGASAIELLPPKTGGVNESEHEPLGRMEMMVEMARIASEYGLDVWVWYPALDGDYSEQAIKNSAHAEWARVLSMLPRLDAIFVPGGDPGDTPLDVLWPFLKDQAEHIRSSHPEATMWLSPQGFHGSEFEEFFKKLESDDSNWLKGVVFGPWVHMAPAAFRARVPEQFPIRYYPDITHTRHCQYPVADWDLAFALTQGREPTCPRPIAMANILRRHQPHTDGAICYSEGCHDDVNKFLWLALSWDPDADVLNVLQQYGRFFIGPRFAAPFANGLLDLERNWQGSPLNNESIDTTLLAFQRMENAAGPRTLKNWRFLLALFRAYYDAYTRLRLIFETALEVRSMDVLREAKSLGSRVAIRRATEILDQVVIDPPGRMLRTRIYQLAEALFQTCHLKLSVGLYHALHTGRGAHLDSLDWPLNSRLWLERRFEEIGRMEMETDRIAALLDISSRTDPGPGGFYDNLGALPTSTRLKRGADPVEDPLFLRSSAIGCLYLTQEPLALPYAWLSHAFALNDSPLEMVYDSLDPETEYEVRVVYAQTEYPARIRLIANGTHEIHDFVQKPEPVVPLTFSIPASATRDGALTLTWTREPGIGGDGQGCQVSEVFLLRKDRVAFDDASKAKWKHAGY